MYNRWAPNMRYSSELYHHGVKGMRWGIRRDRRSYIQGSLVGKRGKLQKELNKTDKLLARDRYKANIQYRKLSKAIAKNKGQEKQAKLMAEYNKHAVNIRKGEAKTKQLLNDVKKSGYTLSERSVMRSMVTGKDIAIMLATGGHLISWTSVSGTKYKVRKPKE